MPVDYTQLLKKLVPEQDAEAGLTLRVATVDAVNADGTVDLEMSSGVIVPNVPRLNGATVIGGDVVQVLSLRGSLLVLGASASAAKQGAIIRTGTVTGGPTANTFFQILNIAFGITFPGIPNVHVNLNTAIGAAGSWVGRGRDITTSQFNLASYGPSTTFSADWQWTAIYVP